MSGLVFDFDEWFMGLVSGVLMRVVLRLFGYCFGVGVGFGWWVFG